ncbi:hypothetical protein, partial [Pectobacterium versatile]|uniref:hypothetical protein n=1 Tax=Pectobacterium versatile TaxID=2488639 RepID=UPI002B24421F
NRMILILLNKVGFSMGLSRMVDHIKPLLRPKSDQQFSHSLGTKPPVRLRLALRVIQSCVLDCHFTLLT